jgi:hypothetical protein
MLRTTVAATALSVGLQMKALHVSINVAVAVCINAFY